MTFRILQFISAALLVWAVAKHPYDYYTMLRFVVCPVSAYAAYRAYRLGKPHWSWVLGMVAVLFNPISKVHLQRQIWEIVNLGTAVITVVSAIVLNSKTNLAKLQSSPATEAIEGEIVSQHDSSPTKTIDVQVITPLIVDQENQQGHRLEL